MTRRLGAFEVLHALKSGGMGDVLLGRRRGPGGFEQVVALKTIRADLAASEAVPTPASTISGTLMASRMSVMFSRFWIPRPLPMGAPSGMTAAAPASSSFFATTTSSLV